MAEEQYQVTAINDLKADYSADHFRFAIGECRKIIALLVAEDNRSEQQVARVHILRYLDLQLSRAVRWVDEEADLMAQVVRSQIELRSWAEFVSRGATEAKQFLHEANIDVRQLHEKQEKAFPGQIPPLAVPVPGKLTRLDRVDDYDEYDFKLCSKLIHPSSLTLNHPEESLKDLNIREYLAVQALFYGWVIIERFHRINWTA
jgi:hypothetical protein